MNKVILMGRLTADPELKQTSQGVSVVRFTIAVNRKFAKEGSQRADFINCIAWRQTGEFIARYFRKGSMIAVDGQIQTRSWDGQDGRRQYATEIVVENAYFTGERHDDTYQPMPDYSNAQSQKDTSGGFENISINEDDLPF